MRTIESTRNETVKLFRSLESAKGRENSCLFLAEGEKLAEDALNASWPLALCLYDPARCEALAQRAYEAGAEVHAATEAVLAAACTTRTPQGIVLAAHIPADARELCAPLLALDGVQDPGNVGTMLRTAEAAGFGGALFGAGSADPFSPKAVRGSMGSSVRVPVRLVDNLAQELLFLRESGWCAAATAMEGEAFFGRGPMPARRILVIGSEGQGVSQEALAACDKVFALPMAGKTQSLNAAVAAGIMMFDWFRESSP